MKVMVDRDLARAANGGVGVAKAGGNYAAALKVVNHCDAQGFDQVLWLNSRKLDVIDEFSGLDFCGDRWRTVYARIEPFNFAGITRDSILALARHARMAIHE